MKRLLVVFLLVILSTSTLMITPQASAAPRSRCFPTGYCVSDPILSYWERHGGLSVFGYPISGLLTETIEGWTGPVQWFERDRLEDHGRAGVMAGRLGAQILEMRGRPWQSWPRAEQRPADCRYFPETGHSLCGVFLEYWRKNGGLARFGYPITEAFQEVLPSVGQVTHPYLVQYFERRRAEYHTELIGTPYEVLLGLLGRNIYQLGGCEEAEQPLAATAAVYRHSLGCPTWAFPPNMGSIGASQQFERGWMIWMQRAYRVPARIYVVFFDTTRNTLVWQRFDDTWYEGEPESGGEIPPPGLYEPIRGFGKLWRTNDQVRNTLGWAAAPEKSESGAYQQFSSGALMVQRSSIDRVFIFYPDGRAEDLPIVR